MKAVAVKSVPTIRLSLLAVALAFGAAGAQAQDTGFYVGAGLGRAQADVDTDAVLARIKTTGATSALVSGSDSDTLGKLFAGYRFNRNFAVEAGYADLGEFGYAATAVPAATQNGKASVKGPTLDLIGTLPLSEEIAAYLRVGVANLRVNQNFSNPAMGAGFANGSERGTHANYGIGLDYSLTDAFSVRAELGRYQLDGNRVITNHVTALTLSALYRFGTAKPVPVAAKPAPAPAPAPQPAPAPAPQPVMKITLAASALFDFDKSVLKPEGKQQLDKLLQDLKGVRYDVIIVTGHTDRIGSHAYNLALSERRASTVKNYLVSGGVPAASITAKGVNSDQPVTKADQCKQPERSAAQKACLAPDRRVEVEVSGTRAP